MKKVVVLGNGIEAKIVANTLCTNPDLEIYVITGVKVNNMFRYSKIEIPNIADEKVSISYEKLGDGSYVTYYNKLSSLMSQEESETSFSKIGFTDSVYLIKDNVDFDTKVKLIQDEMNLILLNDDIIIDDNSNFIIKYDYLINTLPLNKFLEYCQLSVPIKFRYNLLYEVSGTPYSSGIDNIIVFYDTVGDSIFYRHNSYYNGLELITTSSYSLIIPELPCKVYYPGKIVTSREIDEYRSHLETKYPKVKFIGSFARWDYNFGIEKTYQVSSQLLENLSY